MNLQFPTCSHCGTLMKRVADNLDSWVCPQCSVYGTPDEIVSRLASDTLPTSDRIFSPCRIHVLLNCYSGTPIDNRDSKAVVEALKFLLMHKAIEARIDASGETLGCTPLGKAWVHELCEVPVPKAAFFGANGNMIPVTP